MDNLILVLFLALVLKTQCTLSITAGQKMSILRVPFIAYLEGSHDGERRPFAGIILDERLVLTVTPVIEIYKDVTVQVGVANLYDQSPIHKVLRKEFNEEVAILEIIGSLVFGRSVQRSILPKYTRDPYTEGQMFYVAAFGSINSDVPKQKCMELHGRPGYVTYTDLDAKERELVFLLTGPNKREFLLNGGDLGGPVWDLYTGEVVGLIWLRTHGHWKDYTFVKSLSAHRQWIDETRAKMHFK